jgi:hypothetical protein
VKTMFGIVMMTSVVAFAATAHAAPKNLLQGNVSGVHDRAMLVPAAMQAGALVPRSAFAPPVPAVGVGGPVDLLHPINPAIMCGDTPEVCDVRNAAAQRAAEVVAEENAFTGSVRPAADRAPPLSLLLPIAARRDEARQANAIVCDPKLTVKECEALNRTVPTVPQGPLPPTAPPPPLVPPPATPTIPEAPTPPVAADPDILVPPPRTGDDELVKKPPPSASQMPVIKPAPNPPVIPNN